ncbi:MAG: homoserine O-succinyltransferase [Clostridia bacterium]|nr:homoserine O-succinyltransferase [Clostridia bacterium]
MPIVVPKDIPATKILQGENIFVMTETRATSQDIRPLEIAVVNLMPTKIVTETQILRLLSNSPLQVNITLVSTESYIGKNTPIEHLERFYKPFSEVKNRNFDGMIVTGAPVEDLSFSEVKYWRELEEIFEFAKNNVTSTIFICWGAQAALYYYYGIKKEPLQSKMFGIFEHYKTVEFDKLLKGVDDRFYMPHSRHSRVSEEDVKKCKKIVEIARSKRAGTAILRSTDEKFVFITGHAEYDRDTLEKEYKRDLDKGLKIAPPENYYVNEPFGEINMSWASTANLIYMNWLNFVYQTTPYNIEEIKETKSKEKGNGKGKG